MIGTIKSHRWWRRLVWLVGTLGYAHAAWAGSQVDPNTAAHPVTTLRCDQQRPVGEAVRIASTTLAGVPAILRVPPRVSRPPIVLWHGFGPPETGQALMTALPLDDVPAVKVYLGLPLFGRRAPPGGNRELARLQSKDFAMLLFKPAVAGAADELPRVVEALRQRGCLAAGQPIDLMGFSAGGAAALIALINGKVAVNAVAIINASTGLSVSVHALERMTRRPYTWTPASRALAERTDAVRHAGEIARGRPPVALLIVQGQGDNVLNPAAATTLRDALRPYYVKNGDEKRLMLMLVPGMPHGWMADAQAAGKVRRAISDWFEQHG